MTDLEKRMLDLSKEKELSYKELEEIKNGVEDEIDRAALMGVLAIRANLKDKSKEPLALWRFVRYLTEVELPMQIIDFTAMLFPNNEEYFKREMPVVAYELIQKAAQQMLDKKDYQNEEHKQWLEAIVKGEIPYGWKIKEVNSEG